MALGMEDGRTVAGRARGRRRDRQGGAGQRRERKRRRESVEDEAYDVRGEDGSVG